MAGKSGFRIEFISMWLGALVCTIILLIILISVSRWWSNNQQRHLPDLTDEALSELRHPNFDHEFSLDEEEDEGDAKAKKEASPTEEDLPASAYSGWNYEGDSGPKHWGKLDPSFKLCDRGKSQSPIDLRGVERSRDLEAIRFMYEPIPGQLFNDGRSFRFKPVQGNSLIAFDSTYEFKYLELKVPSEHYLDGLQYDMEIQLFHRNVDGEWLVVAILAREHGRSHAELGRLLQAFPKKGDRPADILSFDPHAMLPKQKNYLYYGGSLTTPPCQEGVKWIVFESPIDISSSQSDRIIRDLKFTARPLQRLGERKVQSSWR